MNIYLIIFTCIISSLLSERTFRINNQCGQKLWFGIQGQPLIYSGGFDVDARSTKDINVPDGWIREYILLLTACSISYCKSFLCISK